MSAALSVVLVADHFRTIQRVIHQLRSQSVRDRIEVIIVAPSARELELDETATAGLGAVRIIEVGHIFPMPPSRAAGVRAATAPVVFLGETHSYAGPGFAAAILDAHRGPWDAVVPGFDNANPTSALSWAAFLADYGYWHALLPGGEVASGPTWNVAYKREALLSLGDDLEKALSAGDHLWEAFREAGRKWFHAPSAPLGHVNVSRPGAWVHERFLAGTMIAKNRNARWPLPRRVAYALGSPLIPFVLLRRLWRPWRLTRAAGLLPMGTTPALLAGLLLRTAGEAIGYLRGVGPGQEAQMEEYELHKLKYTVVDV